MGVEDSSLLVNGGFYRDGKVQGAEDAKVENLAQTGEELWNLSVNLTKLD
jgi:hypothetical protein